jgi:hypothetical protein
MYIAIAAQTNVRAWTLFVSDGGLLNNGEA